MSTSAAFEGQRGILIRAPADLVFDYLCDFPQHTEWNHQPTEVTKVTEGPVDVGAIFRAKERPPGKAPWIIRRFMLPVMLKLVGWKGYSTAEITALEPGQRLAWTAAVPLKNGNYWMKADWEIRLEPQNGATRVIQRYHYKPQHQIARSMGSERPAKGAAEEVDANLARLKEILEARAAAQ